MAILPRYFLRTFLPVFLLALYVFGGVLLMNHFLKLFGLAVAKGIPPIWIITCFARLLPFVLSLALPMAYLVALLLALGQLSESGEVTALRSSGYSFLQMTWPFLAVGAALSLALLYLNHKASPEGFHSFRERLASAAQRVARIDLEAGSFTRLGPWKLYAKQVDAATGRLDGVYLVRQQVGQQDARVYANAGKYSIDGERGAVLELSEGEIQLPNTNPETLTSGAFKRYRVEIPLSGGTRAARAPDIQELNSWRLAEKARDPATDAQHRAEYKTEIALRSAWALSCFVFFWVAAPLGLQVQKNSRPWGFALSLAVLFGFYGLLALGISLGRRSEALAPWAPWLADAAALSVGVLFTRRALKR